MYGNNSNGNGAPLGAGVCGALGCADDRAGLGGLPGGGAALRLCREWRFRHCLGDRHGHAPPVRGGHGPGGEYPRRGRGHAERETCLGHDF